MFRKVNLKDNNKSKDKLILMKNSREEFCEIPIEYINEITYEFMQPDVMTLTIPNKTTRNGQTVYSPVFDKILGKRQQMKFNGYTYVITECDRDDEKDKKVKNITAKSYDITLEDSYLYTPMGGMMSHLVKKEGEYEISDGYLDTFVKENPMWKIGHVDDSCRTELNKVSVEQDRNLNNMSFDNVGFDTVLFNQSFEGIAPIDENSTVGIRISFRNIELYDPTTKKLLNTVTKVCDLGLFHIGVKNVKATFTTTDAYRYAINFEVTLVDNTVLSRVCEFVDIKGYNMRCSQGVLLFTDGTLKTVSMLKYRNLEENTYSWRNVLIEYLTEAFDCFVIFDNKNMTVNVYDKKTFGDNKGVYLSYDNFVKGINKSYQYDQIITKLIVESEEEDLSITDENPLGTDYILNYDYFIDNGIMSEQCAKAWKLYESRIDGVQGGLYDLRVDLNTKNSLKIKLDTEVLTLEESIKGLEAIRVGYVKENDTENAQRLSKEINEKYDRVAELVKQLSVVGDEISNLKKQIEVTTKSITMEEALDDNGNRIFTDEDLLEIQSLTISETYTDKYYLTAYGLYNNSLEILKERNKLQIDFTVNVTGLLQNIIIPNGLTWDYYIKIGDKINLEDSEIEGDIRIVKIIYSPKDFKVTNITFTNKDREVDDLQAIGNIGRTVGKLDTVTNSYKPEWKKGMDASKYVNDMLNYGLNLKAVGIRSRSYSVKTDFSESGLFVIDGNDENRQLFMAGGLIGITNDRFETLKVAIDTEGVVADTIVGRLLIGQNLIIANENNSMIIDEEGITIEANKLTIKGVEGQDHTFTSFLEVVNDKISSKVSNEEFNTYKEQTANTISQKVSKGDDFATEFNQNAEGFNFNIGNSSMSVSINKDGINIKDGALQVISPNGTVIIDGSSNMHKIVVTGMTTVTFDADSNTAVRTITHNLGYKPCFSCYVESTEGWVFGFPYIEFNNFSTETLGIDVLGRTWTSDAQIQMVFRRTQNTVDTIGQQTYRIRYYIYKEVAI